MMENRIESKVAGSSFGEGVDISSVLSKQMFDVDAGVSGAPSDGKFLPDVTDGTRTIGGNLAELTPPELVSLKRSEWFADAQTEIQRYMKALVPSDTESDSTYTANTNRLDEPNGSKKASELAASLLGRIQELGDIPDPHEGSLFSGISTINRTDRILARILIEYAGLLRKDALEARLASREVAKSELMAQAEEMKESADATKKATKNTGIVQIVISGFFLGVIGVGTKKTILGGRSSSNTATPEVSVKDQLLTVNEPPKPPTATNPLNRSDAPTLPRDTAPAPVRSDSDGSSPAPRDVPEETSTPAQPEPQPKNINTAGNQDIGAVPGTQQPQNRSGGDADAAAAPAAQQSKNAAEASGEVGSSQSGSRSSPAEGVEEGGRASGGETGSAMRSQNAETSSISQPTVSDAPAPSPTKSTDGATEMSPQSKATKDTAENDVDTSMPADKSYMSEAAMITILGQAGVGASGQFGALSGARHTADAQGHNAAATEYAAEAEETKGEGDVSREIQQSLDEMLKSLVNFLKELRAAEVAMMAAITKG